MPSIEMKSKISKLLGVCKKHKATTKHLCSLSKISGHLESMTADTNQTCQDDDKQHLASSCVDTFARDIETNEPAEIFVEDTSQSQAFSCAVDGSELVEKKEIASNYLSNSDTIFSPVLNDELDGTDRVFTAGNAVHWEIPRWGADESSNKNFFDNQTCNVSDFYISDVLIASLPFDESGNNDVFTEISPLPHYMFPEQYMLLPYLEDGSANTDDVKSDVDNKINLDNHDFFLAFNRKRSQKMEALDHAEAEQAEDFDPQLFIKNQLELSDVVSNYCPRDTLRKKSVTLVLDLDETLVHSTLESCSAADFSFRVFFNMQENTVYVKQRPHLYRFLERVVELFHVVIFTASHSIYASQLLDILDPEGKFISQRYYRDSCIFSDGIYTKDLTVLGLDLAKVAIIDNCPQVYRLQINNGIPIKSWYDDPTDDGLISILPFLETLAVADDVRPIIGRRFDSHPIGRPLRANFREQVDRIRDFSHQQFPDILEARLRRRADRIEKVAEDLDYSARFREAASKRRKAEESARQDSSVKKQNVEPRPDERTPTGAKKTPEQTRAAPKSSACSTAKAAGPRPAQQSARQGARQEEAARRQQIPQSDSARRHVPPKESSGRPEPGRVVLSLAADKARGKRKQKSGPSLTLSGPSSLANPNHIEFNFDDDTNRFVNDRRACGEFLYFVRNTNYPFPELDDLEEKDTYLDYAHARIRSEALLNQIIVDYQVKLTASREEVVRAKDDEHLKAQLKKEQDENKVLKSTVIDLTNRVEQLEKENATTIASLKSDLTSKAGEFDGFKTRYNKLRRSNDALKAENERLRASIEPLSARFERLRLRLVYLEVVKGSSALLDQVRGTLNCLKFLKDEGTKIPQDTLDMMEEDMKTYELQVNAVEVVELEADDLAPIRTEPPEGRAE